MLPKRPINFFKLARCDRKRARYVDRVKLLGDLGCLGPRGTVWEWAV